MTRGLDHVVHVVRDLDAAGVAYERLGFLVGAENRHPWGTRNRLVQLPGFYVELLAVPEPERIALSRPQAFSFGGFNRDFLVQCGEGLAQLALASTDAAADSADFARTGFGGLPPFDFARKGKAADGGEVEVAFSLAFARDPASPHAGFFTCLHKTPERIWFAELQRHGNTATAIAAVVFAADNPTDHHIFLEAFTGARDVHASSLGLRISTPRGEICVYDRHAFADVFGMPPPPDAGLRLAALVFTIADLGVAQKCFEDSDLVASEGNGRLVVGPTAAAGAAIAFAQG
jgi:Glyoxalase-like domain